MMDMWNSKVEETDTVYVLGDFIFQSSKDPEDYLKVLKGKKRLIIGNHDDFWLNKRDFSKYFESAEHYKEIKDQSQRIVLCHYPLMTWNREETGSIMIHGHIHNGTKGAYFPLVIAKEKLLNAGVDVNNFSPVNLEELKENNLRFKKAFA
jgi:calcineurin-like phosphoesterase family protein